MLRHSDELNVANVSSAIPFCAGLVDQEVVWLITIARRVAINDLRRVVAPTTSIDEDAALADSLQADSEEQDPLAHDRLETCLGQLREEYRTAIMMAYVNGYTYDELSGRLDRRVGTLKTWARRGLLDPRSCLE